MSTSDDGDAVRRLRQRAAVSRAAMDADDTPGVVADAGEPAVDPTVEPTVEAPEEPTAEAPAEVASTPEPVVAPSAADPPATDQPAAPDRVAAEPAAEPGALDVPPPAPETPVRPAATTVPSVPPAPVEAVAPGAPADPVAHERAPVEHADVPPARRAVRGTPALVPLAALVAAAVLAAAVLAGVTLRVSNRHATDTARTAALSAASSGVARVLTYDYRGLDSDFSRARAVLTGKALSDYKSTSEKGVRSLATQYKASSTAIVTAAGIIDASPDRVVVLAFAAQTVTNSRLDAPRLDRSRIRVTLVKQHGRWMITDLAPL